MKYNLFTEFNIMDPETRYKFNIAENHGSHAWRLKITGTGVNKGHGPSIPIYPRIRTFDELLNDGHTYIENNEYVKYLIGFIIMNHVLLNSYCTAVDNKSNPSVLKNISDEVKRSYLLYKQEYKLSDISRIRRDANAYALQMRAQGY